MSRRSFLVCLLALVLVRGILVVSAADVFGYGEEFAKGTVAKAILDPLGVEHHRLCYGYGEGGGFAVAHFKALLFLVFGESVLAHKIAALLFASLVLGATSILVAEHASRRAALFFAAAFVLAPLQYQRFSLLGLGTHFEALLFLVLVLLFTLRLQRDDAPRTRDAWSLGLSGGFGLYFSFLLVPMLALSGVSLLARWRGRIPRSILTRGLAGFALGAWPLWSMMWSVGLHEMLLRRSTSDGPKLPFSSSFRGLFAPLAASDPLTWLHALAFVAVIVASFVMRRTRVKSLVAAYLGLYFFAYTTSGLAVQYDATRPGAWFFLLRLVPFWFFLTLLAAIGAAELWERGGRARVLGAASVVIACIAGARDTLTLVRDGRASAPMENVALFARTKGYDYTGYFNYFIFHLEGTDAEKAAVLLRFEDDPRLLVPAVAKSLYEASGRTIEDVLPELNSVFGAHANLALLGLGRVLHGGWDYDVERALAKLDDLPEETREPLAEALGRTGLGPRFRADRIDDVLDVDPPERWRNAWLRGVGWRVHQTFRLRPDLAEARLASQAPDRQRALRAGYDAALAIDQLERASAD